MPAGEEGILEAAGNARLLVVGLSDRWASEGLGLVRHAVAARARSPRLVRRGLQPGASHHPDADPLHVDAGIAARGVAEPGLLQLPQSRLSHPSVRAITLGFPLDPVDSSEKGG